MSLIRAALLIGGLLIHSSRQAHPLAERPDDALGDLRPVGHDLVKGVFGDPKEVGLLQGCVGDGGHHNRDANIDPRQPRCAPVHQKQGIGRDIPRNQGKTQEKPLPEQERQAQIDG